MSYEPYAAAAGAIFGSLVEEGLEEVFPGLGELAYQGEAGGALTALLGTGLAKEKKGAIKSFVKYAYREVNDAEAGEEITEKELEDFSDNFDKIPRDEKEKIVNHYRNVAPHEYHLIKNFIQEI